MYLAIRGYTVILFLSYHIFRVTMSHVDVLEDKLYLSENNMACESQVNVE